MSAGDRIQLAGYPQFQGTIKRFWAQGSAALVEWDDGAEYWHSTISLEPIT